MARRRRKKSRAFGSTADRKKLRGSRSLFTERAKLAKTAIERVENKTKRNPKRSVGLECRVALTNLISASAYSGKYSHGRESTRAVPIREQYPRSSEASIVHGSMAGVIRNLSRRFAHACVVGKKPAWSIG